MTKIIKPNHLKKGDTIGLVSPSSPLAGLLPHRLKKGVSMLEKMGYKIKIGKNALKTTGHTAGSGEERAKDINDFFEDSKVKAIISFVGGNHSNQILKYLDFGLIKKNPKILMGYSDMTVLQLAIFSKTGLVTFYGPAVLTQFAENPEILDYTKKYFKKAVEINKPISRIISSPEWTDEVLDWFKKHDLKRARKMKLNNSWQWLSKGKCRGPIMGGCISSMMHLKGTEFWPDFSNSILFWELPESEKDIAKGESLENIDAFLTDLELLGVLKKIKGMVVGRPFGYSEDEVKKLIELINYHTKHYKFPILFGVDIGHSDPMITVPIGVKVSLDSEKNIFDFIETATK